MTLALFTTTIPPGATVFLSDQSTTTLQPDGNAAYAGIRFYPNGDLGQTAGNTSSYSVIGTWISGDFDPADYLVYMARVAGTVLGGDVSSSSLAMDTTRTFFLGASEPAPYEESSSYGAVIYTGGVKQTSASYYFRVNIAL